MRRHRLLLTKTLLAVLIISTGYGFACNQQPKTVADVLTSAGNVKRDLRARNEITPQQDYDISAKLLAANVAYRGFVRDELARLDAGAPDPSARQAAIRALVDSLKSIQDPSALGLRSDNAKKAWREGIAGLNTVIAGLEALRGGS